MTLLVMSKQDLPFVIDFKEERYGFYPNEEETYLYKLFVFLS